MNNTTTMILLERNSYFVSSGVIVPTEVQEILEVALDTILIMIISIIGIITNIFVIVVLYRQGFKDSVNVSLTAIAFWDLFKCVCGTVYRLYGPIGLASPSFGLTWKNLTHPNIHVMQNLLTYVSNAMTAYVSVERCLSVTIPFKVKTLITSRFTRAMMIVISVTVLAQFAVVLFIYEIKWVEISGETIAVYNFSSFYYEHGAEVMQYYNLMGVLNPLISFVIMVVSTGFIVYHLGKASKFRRKNGTISTISSHSSPVKENKKSFHDNRTNGITNNSSPKIETLNSRQNAKTGLGQRKQSVKFVRDRQVIKMLVVVIIVYVITLIPRLAHYITKLVVPEFYFYKKYHNIFMLTAYIMIISDTVSCITNLFIYLAMSSKFRATFVEVFCRCEKSNKAKKPT